MYLVFAAKEDALSASLQIASNMNLSGNITTTWALPQELTDNKWAIIKPNNQFLTGVNQYTELETVEFKILNL